MQVLKYLKFTDLTNFTNIQWQFIEKNLLSEKHERKHDLKEFFYQKALNYVIAERILFLPGYLPFNNKSEILTYQYLGFTKCINQLFI